MKKIEMYEACDGKLFWTEKECLKYESERFSTLETKGVEWYDEDFNPLKMDINNWDRVKFLKIEDSKTDGEFYNNFCTALEFFDIEQDEKFDKYTEADTWGKTLLIWDEEKKVWYHFLQAQRDCENLKRFVENCRKILN